MIRAALFALLVAGAATTADARVALQDDPTLEDGLIKVAIGNYIRKGCKSISPRMIKAYTYARGLQKHARDLGYSDDEIDAYLDSDPDKERVKAQARVYLAERGASVSKPDTLCAVGRAEIAAESQIGRLLKEN
jgi:hypothetical protein